MNIIDQIACELGLLRSELEDYLFDAPLKYKHYFIPKRKFGRRLIAQPTSDLKNIQRKFLSLVNLPIHDAAMAYRVGLSIKENADLHKKNPYLLSMDLRNFFNSITTDVFWGMCDKNSILTELTKEEKILINKLLFWSPTKNLSRKLVLSVGASSSPTISNFIMNDFDEMLSEYCQNQQIIYTRYADDLSFSTSHTDVLFDVPVIVKSILTRCFAEQVLINDKKTIFSSKAHNRHITGVTITNDGQLSLGRQRKRYIKGLVYKWINNQLDDNEIMHLSGLLSFARHIEPSFITSLEVKYKFNNLLKLIREQND